jgi:hypothetical protein
VIALATSNEVQIAECLQRIFSLEGTETEALITSADDQGSIVTCAEEATNVIGEKR